MKRMAAVDYGRRRIGLAVADPLGITVRGLPTLERGDDLEDAARRTAEVLRAAGAQGVVIGLPLHAHGGESEMSRETRRFGDRLAEHLGVEVGYVDEGLTSWAAEEALRERGRAMPRARRAGEVDRESARLILLTWLREARDPAGEAPDSPESGDASRGGG
jgi:putative Holliday junction resolvase